MQEGEVFTVTFRVLANRGDVDNRVQAMLKQALRWHGLHCVRLGNPAEELDKALDDNAKLQALNVELRLRLERLSQAYQTALSG